MSITYEILNTKGHSVNDRLNWCAGGGRVFKIFKDNGYKICSIQGIYMTGNRVLADKYFPKKGRYTSDLDSMFTLVRGIMTGEFKFETFGLVQDNEDDFHTFLQDEMSTTDGPWFVAMHTDSPGHAQTSGTLRENETELYVERLMKALDYMERDLDALIKNNPEAIVVILGDHGPFLKGGISPDNSLVEELHVRDVYGTLLAIRWPDSVRAQKYDENLRVNQDIFPVIFSYLADSQKPLELMVPSKKVEINGHVFLDNGKYIPFQKTVGELKESE